jgi:phage tail protein X
MLITTYMGEKTLVDLVARLYPTLSGSSATRQLAIDALLNANPRLANLSRLPLGTRIVVPETAMAANPAQVRMVAANGLPTPKATLLYQRLEALKASIPAAAAATVASANAKLALIKKPEVQAAATKDPVLAQRLAAINQRARTRILRAQALQEQFAKAVGPLQARFSKGRKA